MSARDIATYDDLRAEAARRARCSFFTYFPATGPYRREQYPRSLMFFAAGAVKNPDGSHRYRERLFMAANRTGKTVSAAFESTAHASGAYPDWWPGRVFEGPIDMWAAGDTRETTRDIVQLEMFGPREGIRNGTYGGMVPAYLIVDRTLKTGVADCIDTAWILHKERDHGAPCTSTVQFKSYDQGRIAFQGTSKKLIWLDEEPPDASESVSGGGTPSGNGDIMTECLLRTATTDGMLMLTFTPLRGLTPYVDGYLATADMPDATGRIVNAKVGIFGENAA